MAADAANADQVAYWNAGAGNTWAALQELLDRQLDPLSRAALAVLKPASGERVLDIGCGCGASTLELGHAVGFSGAVLGADISAPMLDVARRRAGRAGLTQVRFEAADAQVHPFEPQAWDAVFSRFGVMFFADPTAAFVNLRQALKRGGRVVFVCWRSAMENTWMTAPMAAALQHLPPQPQVAPVPNAPGPFAFADGARTQAILEAAGFAEVTVAPHDERIGARTLDDAVTVAMNVGPLGALLRDNPDAAPIAAAAVRETLAAYEGADGVLMPSATWIVSARNPL